MPFNFANFTQVLAAQNGYELREDVVELTDDQLAYFLSLEGRALPVQISFEDYSPIETMLVLLMEDEAADVTKNDNTLRYTYTAPKDVTIDSIGHYYSVATISFEQNGEEVVFPQTLTQGSTVDIIIHEAYKLCGKLARVLVGIARNGSAYKPEMICPLEQLAA